MRKQINAEEGVKVLRAAIEGDLYAQQAILDHFDVYINYHARYVQYIDGVPQSFIDEDIKAILQEHLLFSLQKFRLNDIIQGNDLDLKKNYE